MLSSIIGTVYDTMKLFIQFDDAENATPGPRVERGKISEMIVQLVGPHENPKLPIYIHNKTTLTAKYRSMADIYVAIWVLTPAKAFV